MGRIAAGVDFGNDVAQPARLNEVATPRAAFGVNNAAQEVGQLMERQGLQRQAALDQAAERQLHEQRVAREKADGAVAQAKMYSLRDQLSDAQAEIDRGVLDGTVAKTEAAKTWAERSKALIDAGLPDVPDTHRETVRLDAQGLAERLTSRVGDAVRKRDQQDTGASINATLEYAQRLAVTEPERARDIAFASLEAAGPAAGLDPVHIGKLKQGWVEGVAYTRAYTAVNAARSDNKALTTVEEALSGNTDIDPQKKAGLLTQIAGFKAANEAHAIRLAQHAEIQAARRQRESDSAYGILSSWALAGKTANPDAAAGLIGKLTPEAAVAYRMLAAEVPARTAAAMLPLDQQSAQLDQLYAYRTSKGTDQRLEAEIKRREQVLAESKRDYAADPLRAGQERGILDTPLRPLDTSSMDGLAAGLAERVTQAQSVQTRTGRAVSPLLSNEADRMARLLQALPLNQRADRIAQVSSLIPADQAQALAGQLLHGQGGDVAGQGNPQGDEKRALGIAFALGAARTTNGRATSELALKGAEALKAKSIKEQTTAVDGWRGQIAKQLDSLYVSPQQAETVGDAARLILAGLVAEGATGSANDAKQAVRLAIGGDVREHNGSRIIIPAGTELQDVQKRVRTLTPADLAPQLGTEQAVYVGGRAVPVVDFLARLPEAQLQYAGRGRYLVKTSGTYAANARRQPLLIDVGPSAP